MTSIDINPPLPECLSTAFPSRAGRRPCTTCHSSPRLDRTGLATAIGKHTPVMGIPRPGQSMDEPPDTVKLVMRVCSVPVMWA